MSTEGNPNDQQEFKRRGPDPRFIWGIVAVVVLCGILFGSYAKISTLNQQLNDQKTQLDELKSNYNDLNQEKEQLVKDKQAVETKFTEAEQAVETEKTALKEKIKEQQSECDRLKDEISTLMNYPGARMIRKIKNVEFAFRWCPAGTFKMGSPSSESDRENIETQFDETLKKGFWMLETEVTVGMFKAFVENTGYNYKKAKSSGWNGNSIEANDKYTWQNPGYFQDNSYPVVCVNWNDAKEFCKWLSEQTGQMVTLPTEAQWEYACRAETTGRFAGDIKQMAWYKENSNKSTHPVATKTPNKWGLYDMHGNVWEWCEDYMGAYPSGSETDSKGSTNGSGRRNRGGSWYDPESNCRSAKRGGAQLDFRTCHLGFRVVIIP